MASGGINNSDSSFSDKKFLSANQAGTEEKRSSKEKSGVKSEVEEISKWDRCCIGPRSDVWCF